MVRQMITEYGMSEKYRNIALPSGDSSQQGSMLGLGKGLREYSEATQQYIDDETARIVNNEYQKVLDMLKENKHILEKVARILLDKEVVEGEEFKQLVDEESKENSSTLLLHP